MSRLEQSLKPCAGFSWRDIKGELIVINMESGEYHSFNDVGRFIWLAIVENKSVDEIIKQIVNQYDVELEKTDFDTMDFIDNLLQRGLIEKFNSKK